MPDLHYPEHLPVVERREDIAAAIRDHQVVVVAGRRARARPRSCPRSASSSAAVWTVSSATPSHGASQRARSPSASPRSWRSSRHRHRLQVRFTDQSSDTTLVKVMTDGILLNEMQHDRTLSRYDTIIIDEAHERSLNIDFILGYLKQLLPRRPDLKVIITSATIDPERFAQHFAAADGTPAPIVEVSGRTYPVEVRYRPLVDPGSGGPGSAATRPGRARPGHGSVRGRRGALDREPLRDIPVFLSGEREIRDTADALASMELPQTEILPLFARLSAAEQHRVFSQHSGRRVVLATNVAETSLTVPGIRYVVDAGTARISGTASARRCSGCRSSRSRRPVPTSGPAAAAGWPTASASGCTPRRTTRAGRSSPSPRSSGPTSPPSSCR